MISNKKPYKVYKCTLYGQDGKIFHADDTFILGKDIELSDDQIESLIKDKKIVSLENKDVDIKDDTSILDNETDSLIKDKSKK